MGDRHLEPSRKDQRSVSESNQEISFFVRHEFAIRRLHSLTGIIPLGLYMCVHLATNASLMNGAETFQWAVYMIHSPGKLLPLIEWGLIFLPLIFHAVVGVYIAKSGRSNDSKYAFTSNRRYKWQRWTGFIALAYLFMHILHLHGWSHLELWVNTIQHAGLAQFRAYNAASTLASAMNNWFWPPFYLVGVLCCVYHFANGLWTAGITWGLWITPKAQDRATKICTVIGVALAIVSLTAWWAAVSPNQDDIAKMRETEDKMYKANLETGIVADAPHKRAKAIEPTTDETEDATSDE